MGYALQTQRRQFSAVLLCVTAILFLIDSSPETPVLETVDSCTLLEPWKGIHTEVLDNC